MQQIYIMCYMFNKRCIIRTENSHNLINRASTSLFSYPHVEIDWGDKVSRFRMKSGERNE